MVFFGDGFDTRAMSDDSQSGYAMSQGGNLARYDLRSGQVWQIKPDAPDDEELRFNWNAGLALDPFDPEVVYYGSQFVHKSTDRGDSWAIISPDMTTDEAEWQQQNESGGLTLDVTAAENYTTIVAIAPSPLEPGLIWVGTDDGRLHVSRDGGDNWTSLEDNVPGVPKNTWIPHIEPSRFDPASAFVVFDDHRRSNWTPYLYRTDDYGSTWTSLSADNLSGYALVIVQDPVDANLLFLGTEFGLWLSVDGGAHWSKWTHGVPTVSVMDLVIHPRDHDLVIGTHGRAIYVIDDIRPLREIGGGALEEEMHLFEIPDAQQFGSFTVRGELVAGAAEFVGQNRPYGALITFSVSDDELEPATGPPVASAPVSPFGPPGGPAPSGPQAEVEILDEAGEPVRTFKAPVHAGLNRAVWNLRRDPFRNPPGARGGFFGSRGGPEVLPGTYSVKVSYRDHSAEGTVTVLADPRTQIADAERQAKWDAILEIGALRELGADAVTRIVELRDDVQAVLKRARVAQKREKEDAGAVRQEEAETPEPSPLEALIEAGGKLEKTLDEAEERFRVRPGAKGIVANEGALTKVGQALGRLQSSKGAPTRSDEVYMRQGRAAIEVAVGALNELLALEVAEFRGLTRAAGIELLPETEPLRILESS